MFKHSVVVEFTKILHFGNTPLEKSKIVLLQAKADGFDDIVDDLHNECRMIAVEGTKEDAKQMNASVLHFSRLRKHLFQDGHNLDIC